jgi:hypothetical protein
MRSPSLHALLAFLIAGALGACASAPPPIVEQAEAPLFADARFGKPTETVSTDRVFEVSDAMRRYLQADIAHQLRTEGTKNGLIQALYQKTQLKLEYDSRMTKTAAGTFAARSGNCLSLVIMTAALAKELRLPVYYQSAILDETWSRTGSLLFASGHVNLTLGHRNISGGINRDLKSTTIDFLLTLKVAAFSCAGLTIISWKGFFKLKYSSKSRRICLSLKFRVMFGGEACNNFGGVLSFGPPCGFCIAAQPNSDNMTKTDRFFSEKTDFLFNPIFSRYK